MAGAGLYLFSRAWRRPLALLFFSTVLAFRGRGEERGKGSGQAAVCTH